jgi:outer membrane protein OmpA-like peptidoglycan-associated protein
MLQSPTLRIALGCLAAGSLLAAQVPNPTQGAPSSAPEQPQTVTPTPVFRVDVVERTTQAVNYLHRSGATDIDFKGTPLMPMGKGSARVESERGVIRVTADFQNFAAPSSFGPEYLTYVLWAISPDGRPVNLGELTLNHYGAGSDSKINTTSEIQTFGMIVTAEPYYAVTQPSDVVVMENIVRKDTKGVVEQINAKYELLPRGVYTSEGKAGGFVPVKVTKKIPFELNEAENAVQLARVAGADKYAADSFQKANDALQQALRYQKQKAGQKPVITMAREAAVRAEDARVISIRRQKDEEAEKERQAGIARENAEKAKAEASRLRAEDETRQRSLADAERAAAEKAKAEAQAATLVAQQQKLEADQARLEAQRQTQEAEQARQAALVQQQQLAADAEKSRLTAADAQRQTQEAEQARQAALVQQQQLADAAEKARLAAADSDRLRQQSEQEQARLREQLYAQFNTILQTRDTARGLIVNMSDVLFDSGQYTLKPGAREKLAKVAGIILGHPGLKIAIEGHTDSVGGDEYNMKLSQNRAASVRSYLVAEGIDPANVTAQGFGKATPVADNNTAAGRQMNRRVEMVVSGDILGSPVTGARTSTVP